MGPKSGAYSSSDPWSSAMWTVFFDIDGDGYREFAMFLNGSSGSPSEEIDVFVSVYSNTASQSIDWETPNIYKLFHNPTAYVDEKTNIILNFQSSLSPIAAWPNGKNETVWDYGSTRAVATGNCGENFIDYQLPLKMLDATSVGGPKITDQSPFSMMFSTANSLNNPLQKDLAYIGYLLGDPVKPTIFGDMLTFKSGVMVQPVIISVYAEGCQPVKLSAQVRDSFDCTSGTCLSSISEVKFYCYFDTNQNGIPDDNNNWLLINSGEQSDSKSDLWTFNWDASNLNIGQYLVGAKSTDSEGNTTWSFFSESQINELFGGHPNYSNTYPEPGVVYSIISNDCGQTQKKSDLQIEKKVNNANPDILDTISYTLLINNNGPDTASNIKMQDILPAGLDLVSVSSHNYSSLNGTWYIQSLDINSQASLYLTVTVLEESEGMAITNTVQIINFDETDTNSLNNTSYAVINVKQRSYLNLSIKKSVNKASAMPGDTIQYQINVTNHGPSSASNITIEDLLPYDLNFISSDSDNYTPSSGQWLIESLSANQSSILNIIAQIKLETNVSLIENTAKIIKLNEIETNTSDNIDSVQTSIYKEQQSADLSIKKESDLSLISIGNKLCYTISVINNGPQSVQDSFVFEQLPESLSYLQHTTSQGQYSPYSCIWNTGPLHINEKAYLIICAKLISGIAGEQIINQAHINPYLISDPTLENNQSQNSVSICGINLRPDHEISTTSGSEIIFAHDLSIFSGNYNGRLSFDITSSQNILWSIFYDANNNNQLDQDDINWTDQLIVSSMSATIFVKTYLADKIPNGWVDVTNIQANFQVQEHSFTQIVTDTTRIIDKNTGDLHGLKEVAIDSNCDSQLNDEVIENKTFEVKKSILPGQCAIYRIHFINRGTGKLYNIVVQDKIPDYSYFIDESATVESIPPGLTPESITKPANNGAGTIIWPFSGVLLPGMSGTVRYEVKVDMY